MNPQTLLSILVETRAKLPNALGTPFLLQKNDQNLLSLSHPMIPEGGLIIDGETHTVLKTLVQRDYLRQANQDDSEGYVVTLAGLSYAAQEDGFGWDGIERRRQEQRSDAMYLREVDRRNRTP